MDVEMDFEMACAMGLDRACVRNRGMGLDMEREVTLETDFDTGCDMHRDVVFVMDSDTTSDRDSEMASVMGCDMAVDMAPQTGESAGEWADFAAKSCP
jgi:hypothetical protein